MSAHFFCPNTPNTNIYPAFSLWKCLSQLICRPWHSFCLIEINNKKTETVYSRYDKTSSIPTFFKHHSTDRQCSRSIYSGVSQKNKQRSTSPV